MCVQHQSLYPSPQCFKVYKIYTKYTNLYERLTENINKTIKIVKNNIKSMEEQKEKFFSWCCKEFLLTLTIGFYCALRFNWGSKLHIGKHLEFPVEKNAGKRYCGFWLSMLVCPCSGYAQFLPPSPLNWTTIVF